MPRRKNLISNEDVRGSKKKNERRPLTLESGSQEKLVAQKNSAAVGDQGALPSSIRDRYAELSPDSDEDFVSNVPSSGTLVADNEVTFNFDAQSINSLHSESEDLSQAAGLRPKKSAQQNHPQSLQIQVTAPNPFSRRAGKPPIKSPRSSSRPTRKPLHSGLPSTSYKTGSLRKKKASRGVSLSNSDIEDTSLSDKARGDSKKMSVINRGKTVAKKALCRTDSDTLSESASVRSSASQTKTRDTAMVRAAKKSVTVKAKIRRAEKSVLKKRGSQNQNKRRSGSSLKVITLTTTSDDTDDFHLMEEYRRKGSIASSKSKSKKRKLETETIETSELSTTTDDLPRISPAKRKCLQRNISPSNQSFGISLHQSESNVSKKREAKRSQHMQQNSITSKQEQLSSEGLYQRSGSPSEKSARQGEHSQQRKSESLIEGEDLNGKAVTSNEGITDVEVSSVPDINVANSIDSESLGFNIVSRQQFVQNWKQARSKSPKPSLRITKSGHGDDIVEVTASEEDAPQKVSHQMEDSSWASSSRGRRGRGGMRGRGRASRRIDRQHRQLDITSEESDSLAYQRTQTKQGMKTVRNIAKVVSHDSTLQRPTRAALMSENTSSPMFSSVDASLDKIKVPVLSSDVDILDAETEAASKQKHRDKESRLIDFVNSSTHGVKRKLRAEKTPILETLASEMSEDGGVFVSNDPYEFESDSLSCDTQPVTKVAKKEIHDGISKKGKVTDIRENSKRRRKKTAKLEELHIARQIQMLKRAQKRLIVSSGSFTSVANSAKAASGKEKSTLPKKDKIATSPDETATDDSVSILTNPSPQKNAQRQLKNSSPTFIPAEVVTLGTNERSQRTRKPKFNIKVLCGKRPKRSKLVKVVCDGNSNVPNIEEIMQENEGNPSETVSSDSKTDNVAHVLDTEKASSNVSDHESVTEDMSSNLQDSIEELNKEYKVDSGKTRTKASEAHKKMLVGFKRKRRRKGTSLLLKKRRIVPLKKPKIIRLPSSNSSSCLENSFELSQRLKELPKTLEPVKPGFSSTSGESTVSHDSESTTNVDIVSSQPYKMKCVTASAPKAGISRKAETGPMVIISETERDSDIISPTQPSKPMGIKLQGNRNLFEKMDSELISLSQENKLKEQEAQEALNQKSLPHKLHSRVNQLANGENAGKTTESSDLEVPVVALARKKLFEKDPSESETYYECSKVQPESVRSTRHFKNSVIPKLKIRRSPKGSTSEAEMPDTPQKDEENTLSSEKKDCEPVQAEALNIKVQEELLFVYADKQEVKKKPRRKQSYQDDEQWIAFKNACFGSNAASLPKKRGRPFSTPEAYRKWIEKKLKLKTCSPKNRMNKGPCRSEAAIQRSKLEKEDYCYDPIKKVQQWMSGNQSNSNGDSDFFYSSMDESGLECGAEVEVKALNKKTLTQKVDVRLTDIMDEWEAGTLDHQTERWLSMSLESHKHIVTGYKNKLKHRKELKKKAEMDRYLSEITATESDLEEKEETDDEVDDKPLKTATIKTCAIKEVIELSEPSDIYDTCSEPDNKNIREVLPDPGEHTDHSYYISLDEESDVNRCDSQAEYTDHSYHKSPYEEGDREKNQSNIHECDTMVVSYNSQKQKVDSDQVNTHNQETEVTTIDTTHCSEEATLVTTDGNLTLSQHDGEKATDRAKSPAKDDSNIRVEDVTCESTVAACMTQSDEAGKITKSDDYAAPNDDGKDEQFDDEKSFKNLSDDDEDQVDLTVDKSDNEDEPDFDEWMQATLLDAADDDPSPIEGDGEDLSEDIYGGDTELLVSQKHFATHRALPDHVESEKEEALQICSLATEDELIMPNTEKNRIKNLQCTQKTAEDESLLEKEKDKQDLLPDKDEDNLLPDEEEDHLLPDKDHLLLDQEEKDHLLLDQQEKDHLLPDNEGDDLLPDKEKEDHLLPDKEEDHLLPDKEEDHLLPDKEEKDHLLPDKEEVDHLLPDKEGEEHLLPDKEGEDHLLPDKEEEDHLLPDKDGEEYLLPDKEGEEYLLPDKEGEDHLLPDKDERDDVPSNKDVEDREIVLSEDEFSQLWSDHDDSEVIDIVASATSQLKAPVATYLSQRAVQPKARDTVLLSASKTLMENQTPQKKDQAGFLQPDLSDIPKSSRKFSHAKSPKTHEAMERLINDSLVASDSLLEVANDAFEFSQQEVPIVISDDEDNMFESFSQLSQSLVKVEANEKADEDEDEELLAELEKYELSVIEAEEDDQDDAKSVVSSASSIEHHLLDLTMPEEEEDKLEEKNEHVKEREESNAEECRNFGNLKSPDQQTAVQTKDKMQVDISEDEATQPLDDTELPLAIKLSTSDNVTAEEKEAAVSKSHKSGFLSVAFKDLSDTEESSPDDFRSPPKLNEATSKTEKWLSKGAQVKSTSAITKPTAAPKSSSFHQNRYGTRGARGRKTARGRGAASSRQLTQGRLVDGIERARQQAQERLNKGKGHHDAQEAKEQNKIVEISLDMLEDKTDNCSQIYAPPTRMTRSGSKSSALMDTPPSLSTRSASTKTGSIEDKQRRSKKSSSKSEKTTPKSMIGPLTSTPFAALRSKTSSETSSVLTPIPKSVSGLLTGTPCSKAKSNVSSKPVATVSPRTPAASLTSRLPPSRQATLSLPPPMTVPPPKPIISPPHHLDHHEASYNIPPMAEEPDFDDLSTKFLPPDSQLSSPAAPPPLVKSKQPSLPPANMDVSVKRTLNDFIDLIVRWNPMWLAEQEKVGRPPPLVPPDSIFPLLETYDSYEDYVKIMMPLLFIETWEQMYRSWLENKQKRSTLQQSLFLCGLGDVQKGKHMEINFQGVLKRVNNGPLPKTLCENDVVVVHLKLGEKGRLVTIKPVFGVVRRVNRCYSTRNKQIHPALEPLLAGDNTSRPGILLEVSIQLTYRELPYKYDERITVEVVNSLVTSVRQYSALIFLPRSPLARDILRPVNTRVFKPDYCPPLNSGKTSTSLNVSQQRAILSTTYCAALPYALPQISLLQGPPGTGKSTTIISLVKKILVDYRPAAGRQRPRLLVCAPSNGGVDVLTRRIIKERKHMDKNHSLNIVRAGNSPSMHEEVKPYSLDVLAQKRIKQWQEEKAKAINSNLSSVHSAAAELDRKIEMLQKELEKAKAERRSSGSIRKLEADIATWSQRRSKLSGGKKQAEPRMPTYGEEQEIRARVLREADVVCCTLNGCGSSAMIDSLRCARGDGNAGTHFTTIIVDEATQCTEVDCLVPLQYGCTKLILVGDPEQLPATVISKDAESMNYGQSLFERLYQYFRLRDDNPVNMLDIQYRMHPAISHFPSMHVYDGRLKNDEAISKRRENFPFKAYRFFDVEYSREEQRTPGAIYNPAEAEFVASIAERLLRGSRGLQQYDIGVITPYQQQRKHLKELLARRRLEKVDVGTVDGFQGREKTVVIVTCVRAKNNSGSIGFLGNRRRMNVALTRAKYAMYIVAHLSSLKVDADWKALIEDAQERKVVSCVRSSQDANKAIEDGILKKPDHNS